MSQTSWRTDKERPTYAAAVGICYGSVAPRGYSRCSPMEYPRLEALQRTHPAWRLLRADHAPMIIGFLHATFIVPNVRSLSEGALVSKLDDYLHRVREQREDAFPRSAAQYVDTWSSDECGWLRKYYPPDGDEAWFDITPATEKAIDWLKSLEQRQFVGTESRLKMVFDLLRQMVFATELDVGTRVAELEKKRAEIDGEIQRIRAGRLDLMDPIQVKDCFQQMASTARGLLSDFRELEQNFRDLDRALRERRSSESATRLATQTRGEASARFGIS